MVKVLCFDLFSTLVDVGSDELVGAKAVGMQALLMTRFLKNNKAARQQAHVGVVDGEVGSTMEVLAWLVR